MDAVKDKDKGFDAIKELCSLMTKLMPPERKKQVAFKMACLLDAAGCPKDRMKELITDVGLEMPEPCKGCGHFHPEEDPNDLRGYAVNIDPLDFNDDPELSAIIEDYQKRGGPKRIHQHNQIYSDYSIAEDMVHMAENVVNGSKEMKRRVLLHEFAHSTGHKSRLNRLSGSKSQRDAALEEVIAERTAQIVLKAKGMIDPKIKAVSDDYIKGYARDFEKYDGMTLGEVRMEAEPYAVKAAELILGKPLARKPKAVDKEAVTV